MDIGVCFRSLLSPIFLNAFQDIPKAAAPMIFVSSEKKVEQYYSELLSGYMLM